MADIINLPARAGTIEYDEDTIQDIVDTLQESEKGQGVRVDDNQDSENKARTRSQTVRDIIKRDHDLEVKAHAIKVADDAFIPAVSIPVNARD